MQNLENSTPQKTNYAQPLIIGCLGVGLLSLFCVIIFGALAYLQGYSLPHLFAPATPTSTETPLPTHTLVPTSTFTPSNTPTSTQTSTATLTPTATVVFHTATFVPTRTITPTPKPTKTRTPTPTSKPISTIYNDTYYGITYSAWWGLPADGALGNGMRCSSRKNEVLVFDTVEKSTTVSLLFYKGPDQGKATIYIDNVVVETLDLYKPSPQYLFERKYKDLDPNNPHNVKVVVLHQKRNASSDYRVCVDGFKVGNTLVDDTTYNVRYNAWIGKWNERAQEGGYRIASLANTTLIFSIQGNSFQWITALGPNYGQADIYVDDQFVATADFYSPVQKWQQIIPINNLGRGSHTIKIVVLGQHNSASGGTGIVFDGIIVP
jgi:hypothetical protein